jgi:hypothetical protein
MTVKYDFGDRRPKLSIHPPNCRIKMTKVAIFDSDECLTAEIVKNFRLTGMEHIQVFNEGDTRNDCDVVVISGNPADVSCVKACEKPVIYAIVNGSYGAVSSLPESSDVAHRVEQVNEEVQIKPNGVFVSFQPTVSIIGAVVAQEVLKVVTHQHPPIDNTFILDSMELRSIVKSL